MHMSTKDEIKMSVTLTRARSRERARRAAGVERSDWALVKVKTYPQISEILKYKDF